MIAPRTGLVRLPEPAELQRLIQEHARPLPRYTSYPTVPYWDRDFGEAEYRGALERASANRHQPLSVYVHLPFCAKRCYYCGCNAMVTHRDEIVDGYLDHLALEIHRVQDYLGSGRRVTQLHLGGGTPNFLTPRQMSRLVRLLTDAFPLAEGAEVAVEMDPRIGSPEQARHLRALGFTRMSMGVQDFEPRVQAAIGRIQPEEQTVSLMEAAREAGFASVNVDLVYGLPYQTPESFRRTLERIVELAPDRVATFSYAHLPELRKNQRAVDTSGLPDDSTKLDIFLTTVRTLTAAGYDWIGFDHFARPDDELSLAVRDRRLLRNFMGYTTRSAPDQVAFGVSGIGALGGCFVQTETRIDRYRDTLAGGGLPIVRGHWLSEDDRRRAAAIQHLMCNLELPDSLLDAGTFGASPELARRMEAFAREGFLRPDGGRGWQVSDLGRFFLRNLAAELDAYLGRGSTLPTFSSSI